MGTEEDEFLNSLHRRVVEIDKIIKRCEKKLIHIDDFIQEEIECVYTEFEFDELSKAHFNPEMLRSLKSAEKKVRSMMMDRLKKREPHRIGVTILKATFLRNELIREIKRLT
ncbi:hypothetical protein ACFL22_00930 [Patescibacteria group bacterium]